MPEIKNKSHVADDAYDFLAKVLQKLKNKEIANVDKIRTPEISRQQNRGVETALHCMVQEEDIDMVKLLLKLGAKADALDVQDRTPVHFACCRDGRSPDKHDSNKSFEIAKVLLASKTASSIAWKNMKTKIGDETTPIHLVNGNDKFTSDQKTVLLNLLGA